MGEADTSDTYMDEDMASADHSPENSNQGMGIVGEMVLQSAPVSPGGSSTGGGGGGSRPREGW